jgi:CHAT domain-containing protein
MGFMRAFFYAGAPRVVASLWRVPDESTKALMVAFYGRMAAGVPTARALREAQETVRRNPKWSQPRYWAAWVLWGLPD